jgi:hypothetical protein
MIITLIVVAFAILALVAILGYALRGPWSRKANFFERPVDLRVIRLLAERDDETYLREKVPARKFKALKRQRIAVTLKYIDNIAQYVTVTQAATQESCESPDPAVAHGAMQIMDLAAEIHKQCMVFRLKLTIEFVFPSLQLAPAMLVQRYQAFRESVNRLNAIQAQRPTPTPPPAASMAIAS